MFGNNKFLPYGRQLLGGPEYRAVRRVLRSPYLTQGPCVQQFERDLCQVTGAPYAVAVANGTLALDLAVRALKLRLSLADGALAVTAANTFVASGNALLYNGFKPLFGDINPASYNLDLTQLQHLLGTHSGTGAATIELLLPVHFAGEPLDMVALRQLTTKSATAIVEDAAHALGSHYASGEPVGSCVYSDACCFSFHPVKTVTTAEGGAITCREAQLYEILLLLRNHGLNRDPDLWQNAADNCTSADLEGLAQNLPPPWYYEMQILGHNARLSDVHAALGIEQLRRLPRLAAARRRLAAEYTRAFSGLHWLRPPRLGAGTCPHLYVLQIDFDFLRLSRNEVMRQLLSLGIGTQVHYIPLPLQPFYRRLGYRMDTLPKTYNYYRHALSLPLYPGLKAREQKRIIRAVQHLAKF